MFALGRKLDQESLGHVELPGMLFKTTRKHGGLEQPHYCCKL
jgi:hypothetical protein